MWLIQCHKNLLSVCVTNTWFCLQWGEGARAAVCCVCREKVRWGVKWCVQQCEKCVCYEHKMCVLWAQKICVVSIDIVVVLWAHVYVWLVSTFCECVVNDLWSFCAYLGPFFSFWVAKYRRSVDSFLFRRMLALAGWPKLAKVMPDFSVNFVLSIFLRFSCV